MEKRFLSFGSNEFQAGLCRLGQSASKIFDKVRLYEPNDLPVEFKSKNKELFENAVPKGYGYWVWKPYLILQELLAANEGDLVFYSDALLEFIPDRMNAFLKSFVATGYPYCMFHQKYSNIEYTKADCFLLMNVPTESYYVKHLNAAFVGFVNSEETRNFVTEWLKCCENIELIDDLDRYSTHNPAERYKSHRHDQSILSILCYKYNISTYDDISQYGNSPFGICINHHRTK